MEPLAGGSRPRWHRERMPIFWWLGKWAYTRFILRELTSLGVAWSAALLVVHARALGRGGDDAAAFAAWLRAPWVLALNAVALLLLLYHSVTWLGLAPRALRLRLGGRRVPDGAVLAGHYLAWAAASAAVAALLLGGRP